METIWFATNSTMRTQGFGGMLLRCIHSMASHLSVVAILVESSDAALGWWISRRSIPVCTSIVSTCNDTQVATMVRRATWAKYISTDLSVSLDCEAGGSSLGLFHIVSFVPEFLSGFYAEPYRYKTCDANHVWIPVDATPHGAAEEMWKHAVSRQWHEASGKLKYAQASGLANKSSRGCTCNGTKAWMDIGDLWLIMLGGKLRLDILSAPLIGLLWLVYGWVLALRLHQYERKTPSPGSLLASEESAPLACAQEEEGMEEQIMWSDLQEFWAAKEAARRRGYGHSGLKGPGR